MKTHYLFFILSIALLSCSDKHDALYVTAKNPEFGFSRDTLSIREKDPDNINNTGKGMLTLFSGNASQQLNIQYSDTSNHLQIRFNGDIIQAGQPILVSDSTKLFVSCDIPGVYSVDFVLTDQLGKQTTKTLLVECLPNQQPTAEVYFSFFASNGLESWVYSFNGGLSRDDDGMILHYHYLIDGISVLTNSTLIEYTLHTPGDHAIALYVTDDLGVNSDTIHRVLTIQ